MAAQAHFDGGTTPVIILDISHDGMRIASLVSFTPGTVLEIEVLHTRAAAIVHWCKSGHAGLRLAERLDRDTLYAIETAADDLSEFR